MRIRPEYRSSDRSWLSRPGEFAPEEQRPFDSTHTMIVIPAVPSSGTSMVAGVLEQLGVNMGNWNDRGTQRRGYPMFEDADIGMYSYMPQSPVDKLLNMRIRFREYLNYRFDRQEGVLGVKTLPTVWMWDPNPGDWPIRVLDVRRPLEVSIQKDAVRLAERENRDASSGLATAWQSMNRAGGLGAMYWAREMLLKFHPAKLTVEYDDFRADPATYIEQIVEVFNLEPNDYQMTAALLSVRR